MSLFKALTVKGAFISNTIRGYATKSLFIGNLPFRANAEDLRLHFEKYDVSKVTIPTDQAGRSRGFAFIEVDENNAEDALQELNESELLGRRIRVAETTSKGRF